MVEQISPTRNVLVDSDHPRKKLGGWLILVIVLIVVIISAIFFWITINKGDDGEIIVRYEPPDNYIVKETPEGKIVENQKAGLTFKVPDGWDAGVYGERGGEGLVQMTSKDIEIPYNKLPIKGCIINAEVEYRPYEKETHSLARLIEETRTSNKDNNKEVVEVSSYQALKSLTINKPELGSGFEVSVPMQNGKIYVFSAFFPLIEGEKCPQEFNGFLQGISIKNN